MQRVDGAINHQTSILEISCKYELCFVTRQISHLYNTVLRMKRKLICTLSVTTIFSKYPAKATSHKQNIVGSSHLLSPLAFVVSVTVHSLRWTTLKSVKLWWSA